MSKTESKATKRQIKTLRGIYDVVEWDGKNGSKVQPIGDFVLVLPDQAAEKTTGGIITGSDDERERVSLASETGVIVALGDTAFVWNSDRTRAFTGKKPKVGDRVFFARYSGQQHTGKDGKFYMLMFDKSIAGFETDT